MDCLLRSELGFHPTKILMPISILKHKLVGAKVPDTLVVVGDLWSLESAQVQEVLGSFLVISELFYLSSCS